MVVGYIWIYIQSILKLIYSLKNLAKDLEQFIPISAKIISSCFNIDNNKKCYLQQIRILD